MFRSSVHLLLTAVLLGCPFLCQQECAGCASQDTNDAGTPTTCCSHCENSPAENSAPSRPHDEQPVPCDPLHTCECDCLCNGAITGPSVAVSWQTLFCRSLFVAAEASAPVSVPAAGMSADLPPPLPAAHTGRALRAVIMSFLC